MSNAFFRDLHARFDASGVRAVFAPRKPRHPALRVLLGLVGVALLAVLLVAGLFVGAAMLLFGLARRLLVRGGDASPAHDDRIVEAEYRVVRNRDQPLLR
ncbi:hypothetical protein MNO14_12420 [Luteimonas sp. S4-F44]|uniref:hypothetical protein n=1 Tax=Luteimonas sp. S4-F44 TaxID=2925842 RepID=UPI001F53CE45|nr:hypothetical protein [Luteimonas sp. S4-F44]UNK41757.1 hypothetical protein MNO14_12420 [Luteimonas sp. S4-F44]